MKITQESKWDLIEINDFGIYGNIPDVSNNRENIVIKPNSKIKYDSCYYSIESNGELVLISTGDASGRLVIPQSITINGEEHQVTRIGEMVRYNVIYTDYHGDRRRKPTVTNYVIQLGAFFDTKVTECVFPSTLREFTGDIFYGSCSDSRLLEVLGNNGLSKCHLKRISFSDDRGSLESIGSKVFRNCCLEMDCLRLPEGLRHIGDEVFWGTFTKVKLPSTIETIGDNAFWYCNIKSINLPEGLESVGNNFIDITYCVERLEFPSKIKRIPQLEWNTTDRWNDVSKSLPEIVVNNGKKDVTIEKITSKNCKLEFIDKTGKREVDKKRIRNYCFKEKHPKDIEELNQYHVSLVGILCFCVFMLVLLTVLSILIGTGVLD